MHQRRRRTCKVQVKQVASQGYRDDIAKVRNEGLQYRIPERRIKVVVRHVLLVLVRGRR